MKFIALFLTAVLSSASAQLPQISSETEWLGYFVGWEGRDSAFGIGADGEAILIPIDRGNRLGHKEVKIHYLIEEKIKGRWVHRQFLKEGGLVSENEKGIDPEKPVVLVTTVTGGTRVEWTHSVERDEITIQPKLVEKGTGREVRIGLEFALPRLYRFDEAPDERELKNKIGKDYVKATRLKDRKKIRVRFHELDEDLLSDDHLAEGASEIEVRTKAMRGMSLFIANGGRGAGRIDVQTKGPLYQSFRMTWLANPEELGEDDCAVTFSVE